MIRQLRARPFATAKIDNWTNPRTGNATTGINIMGQRGLAAHLTTSEARTLADRLHDLSDELEATLVAKRPKVTAVPRPRPRLTAADGTEEPPLEATPAG